MPRDRETTALFRAVARKGREDDMTTRAESSDDGADVFNLIDGICEEVKRRAVVPEVDLGGEPHRSRVCPDELDMLRTLAQLGPEPIECSPGNVECPDRRVPGVDQFVDKGCGTSADEYKALRWHRHAAHEVDSGMRRRLVPTAAGTIAAEPHLVPMLFQAHDPQRYRRHRQR